MRHLPSDIGVTFLFVIEVCLTQARGDRMRQYMEGLWAGAQRCRKTRREQRAIDESLERFESEYGKAWDKSLSGAIDVLVDLGLVVRYEIDGDEVLDVPDSIPTPEQRLNLNDEEKGYLLELARREPRGYR